MSAKISLFTAQFRFPKFFRRGLIWFRQLLRREPLLIPIFQLLGLALLLLGCFLLAQKIYDFFRQPKNQTAAPTVFRKQLLNSHITATSQLGNLQFEFVPEEKQLVVQAKSPAGGLKIQTPVNQAKLSSTPQELNFASETQALTLQYQALPNGIKENIVLQQLPEENIFISQLEVDNLNAYYQNGQIVFTDQQGNYQFHLAEPYAYDAAGQLTHAVNYQIVEDTSEKDLDQVLQKYPVVSQNKNQQKVLLLGNNRQTITPEVHKKYKLLTTVNKEWLFSAERKYPVTIDPTLIYDTSAEFASGQLNRVKDSGSGSSPNLSNYYLNKSSDNNTVLLWHMDETSGSTITDSSPNSISSSAINTSIVDGVFGKARSFNGSSSYLTASLPLNFTDYTESFWIKISAYPTTTSTLISHNNTNDNYSVNKQIYLSNTGAITADDYLPSGGGISSTSNLPLNEWHHIAVTRQGKIRSIYIDGRLDASDVNAEVYNGQTPTTLFVGADIRNSQSQGYFTGSLDEIKISRVALSAEEIRKDAQRSPWAIYTSDPIDLNYMLGFNSLLWTETGVATGNGETLSNSTGLVAQWNFNETSGTTATNNAGSCGSSCNASLLNFSSTGSQDASPRTGWTSQNRRWGVGALMFDGSDDIVKLNSYDSTGFTAYSVEAWIKTTSTTSSLIVQHQGLMLYVNRFTAGKVFVGFDDSSGNNSASDESTSKVNDGQWHYLVGTNNGTTTKLYIDGHLEKTYTDTLATGPQPIGIGGNAEGGGANFSGVIDSVRIYSRELPASEILANFNSSNLELQTRVGDTSDPSDGSWEDWIPSSTAESLITSFENTHLYTTNDTGLVAYWPMDETSGSTITDQKNSYTMTATAPQITDGEFGKGRRFSGVNSVFSINSNFGATTTGAFEAWFRTTSTARQTLIGQSNQIPTTTPASFVPAIMLINGTLRSEIFTGATTGTPTTKTYNDGQWHQVVLTYDSNNQYFYIDGKLSSSRSGTTNQSWWTYTTLGAGYDSTDRGAAANGWIYFYGDIDEVKFYNSLLSASTILQHYITGSGNANYLRPETSSASDQLAFDGNTALKLITGKPVVDSNTMGLWHLDEITGSGAYLKDSSPFANNGTPNGTTIATSAVSGKARTFNGSNTYISIPDSSSLDLTDNFTISAWVNKKSNSNQTIVSKASGVASGGGFALLTGTNGEITCRTSNGSSFVDSWSNYNLVNTTSGWVHVAAVKNGSSCRLYVNGIDQTLNVGTHSTNAANNLPLVIGARADLGLEFWNGDIDEVKLSNTARSAADIQEEYRKGANYYENYLLDSPVDFSSVQSAPIYIAADRPGSYLTAIWGESAFANYQADSATVGLWHFDEILSSNLVSRGKTTYASASSGGASSQAVDSATNTYWGSGTASTSWITVDLGTPQLVNKVRILPYGSPVGTVTFDIQGSNDNSSFTSIISGATGNSNGTTWADNTFAPVSYRYIRINCTNWATSWVAISEIEVYAAPFNTTLDASGNGYTGTSFGSTTAQGYVGKGRAFSGADRINVPITANLYAGQAFTLSAWVYRTADYSTAGRIFISSNDRGGMHINQSAGYKLGGYMYDTTYREIIGNTVIPLNTWTYITTTFSAGTLKLYVNGQLDAQGSYGSMVDLTNLMYIGNWANNLQGFVGIIDEARIDSIARSADEIRQAFEVGQRSHQITIDFAASLEAGNVITDSTDLSFSINGSLYGLSQKASNLFVGDRIIIKENSNGTEYIAQGVVNTVNATTGAVTVSSWLAGSTFPSGGFLAGADVFKWQREYLPIQGRVLNSEIDQINLLSLRLNDGNEGRTIWLDDWKKTSGYLSNPLGSAIGSSLYHRYFQFRTIFTNTANTSPALGSVTLDYQNNHFPTALTASANFGSSALNFQLQATDADNDALVYKITVCSDATMTTNCQSWDQTLSQGGWSGQNTDSNLAYTPGTIAYYTTNNTLQNNTTYYWQAAVKDPAGVNTWINGTINSATVSLSPTAPTDLWTEGNVNPSDVYEQQPGMSAVFTHPDNSEYATQYQLQVSLFPNFSTILWDTGQTAISWNVEVGQRGPQITYGNGTLPRDGKTYYWRIRFYDSYNREGAWSEVAYFTMHGVSAPFNCLIQRNPETNSLTITWQSTYSSFTVQKKIDNQLQPDLSDVTGDGNGHGQFIDNSVQVGHQYQYLIRSFQVGVSSAACETPILDLQQGQFNMEGINMQGVNVY